MIAAVAVGYFMTASVAALHQTQAFKSANEGKDLIVHGQIESLIKSNGVSRSFLFNVTSASLVNSGGSINFKGLIQLSIYNKKPMVKAGQTWQFQVRLKRGAGFKNPGGFDYEKWLFAQSIHAKGYIRKSDQHKLLEEASWYSVNSLREMIHHKIKMLLASEQNNALVSALILAEKSDLSKEQWGVFRATGTSHLMAISGLHIGLVASSGLLLVWFIWWSVPTLNLFITRRLAGSVVGAALAISYALLAGMNIPTQRALIMVLIGLYLLAGRQYFSAYRVLALAMIAVLIIDPLAIMGVGFYLSFCAVFVIVWLSKRVIKAGRFGLFKLQGFLSLLMIPLSLLFFGEGSLIAPIANLIAIPWVSFVIVPLSMLSVLLSFVSETLASYLFQFLSWHLDALFMVLGFLAKAPASILESYHLSGKLLAALVIAGLILLLPAGLSWRYTACLCLLPLLFFEVEKPKQQGSFWLTVLDVGQGLAVVIETKHHSLLYDTGNRMGDSFDLGEMVVSPYLKRQSIKVLDALVISHDDRDHMGGLTAVLNAHETKVLYGNRLALVESRHNVLCVPGKPWVWDGVKFEFLHPTAEFDGNNNNRSCVLRVSTKNHSVLLSGDIQRKAENYLLRQDGGSSKSESLKADILLMPHHGSNTSSQTHFINAVNPKWAIASAGYRSRFKHPAKRVVARYESLGVKVLNTAESGAMQFRMIQGQLLQGPIEHRPISRKFWSR